MGFYETDDYYEYEEDYEEAEYEPESNVGRVTKSMKEEATASCYPPTTPRIESFKLANGMTRFRIPYKWAPVVPPMNTQGLTAAEGERLVLLMEEAGEVVQAAAKVLRHGYSSTNPLVGDARNNRDLLTEEVGHLEAVIHRMTALGDLSWADVLSYEVAKKVNVIKYLHHNSWSHRYGIVQQTTNTKQTVDVAPSCSQRHDWEYRNSGYDVCTKCSLSDTYAGRDSICSGVK